MSYSSLLNIVNIRVKSEFGHHNLLKIGVLFRVMLWSYLRMVLQCLSFYVRLKLKEG